MHAFFLAADRAQLFITSISQEHGSTATLRGLTPSATALWLHVVDWRIMNAYLAFSPDGHYALLGKVSPR